MFKKTGRKPPVSRNAFTSLALAGNMITPDEHQAVLRGWAEIIRSNMLDENSHGLGLRYVTPLSAVTTLYHNRCDDIMIKKLLGENGDA